jgi:hypothetical protein
MTTDGYSTGTTPWDLLHQLEAELKVAGQDGLLQQTPEDLVDLWRAGNELAFVALMVRIRPLLLRAMKEAGGLVGFDNVADLTGSMWEKVARKARQYDRSRAAFSTYIYAAVRHAARHEKYVLLDLTGNSRRVLGKVMEARRTLPQRLARAATDVEVEEEAVAQVLAAERSRFKPETARRAVQRVMAGLAAQAAGAEEDDEHALPAADAEAYLKWEPEAQHVAAEEAAAAVEQGRDWAARRFALMRAWLGDEAAARHLILFVLHEHPALADVELPDELLPGRDWAVIAGLLKPGAAFPTWPAVRSRYGLAPAAPAEWADTRSLIWAGDGEPSVDLLKAQYKRANDRLLDCRRLHELLEGLRRAAGEVSDAGLHPDVQAVLAEYAGLPEWPFAPATSNRALLQRTERALRHMYVVCEALRQSGRCAAGLTRLDKLFRRYGELAHGMAPGPAAVGLRPREPKRRKPTGGAARSR